MAIWFQANGFGFDVQIEWAGLMGGQWSRSNIRLASVSRQILVDKHGITLEHSLKLKFNCHGVPAVALT